MVPTAAAGCVSRPTIGLYAQERHLGLDLRDGFDRCTWRPEELDESLDALIDTYGSSNYGRLA